MNCPGSFNGSTTEECVEPESDTSDNGELAIPLQRRLTRESRVTKPQDVLRSREHFFFLVLFESQQGTFYDQGNITLLSNRQFLGVVCPTYRQLSVRRSLVSPPGTNCLSVLRK
jgi:hypothetical protein